MRRSVVGPLILIGVGVLFLLHNVYPDIAVGEIFGRYWPFLLVFWGVLRLIEVLALAGMSKPLPRNSVSGGEWVLVVFIFLIGSAVYAAHNYTGWFPDGRALRGLVVDFGEPFDYTVPPATQACGKTPRLVIENFRGNARITGGDADSIQVSGRKTIRAMQQKDADQADKQTPMELIASNGNTVTIRLNQDHVSDRLRVSHDLDITVPKGASVECHGRYGDFDVRGIGGNAEITSDNAGIRLQDIGGAVKINVQKSDIVRAVDVKGTVDLRGHGQDVEFENIAGQVTMEGSFTGQLQFRNLAQPLRFDGTQTEIKIAKIPGEFRLSPGDLVATNLVGPVQINARSRDVQISGFTQSLDLTVDRGDVELRPTGANMPKMDVRTRSGDIDLGLPDKARFDLKAQTDHGEVHDEFGAPLATSELGDGAMISGTAGSGPSLRLQTGRGSVTVRKSGTDDDSGNPAPEPPKSLKAPKVPAPPPSAPTSA